MPDIFQDSSRYFHISAFYALSLPYYHMEHHTHSSYEIMYITSGSCRVFCMDEEQDMEFPLKSGQFIFIRPGIPHRLEIPDGFPCSILNLEFSLTSEKSPVSLELLLKKDPGFSRFWNFIASSRGFCSGTDSRNFGYSLKDLLTFLQRSSDQIKEEEFLFFLLFGRMLTELAFCARSSRNTQGSVYLKKRSGILMNIIWKTSIFLPLPHMQGSINPTSRHFLQKKTAVPSTLISTASVWSRPPFFCATALFTLRILPFLPDITAGSILHIPSKNFIT